MRASLIPLAAAPVLATSAGCGGGTVSTAATSHSGKTSQAVRPTSHPVVSTDPSGEFKFTKAELATPAGEVTLVMHNPSPIEHDIAIKGGGVDVRGKLVGHGGTTTVKADLEPGTYTFYCSVPGHAQAGMTGTLRVQ